MKLTHQRKIIRLDVDLEKVLLLLRLCGYLDKERAALSMQGLTNDEALGAIGDSLLPDDARMVSASVGDRQNLLIDIEADSFGEAIAKSDGGRARLYLPHDIKDPHRIVATVSKTLFSADHFGQGVRFQDTIIEAGEGLADGYDLRIQIEPQTKGLSPHEST